MGTRQHRWFQFSLRTLLVLIVVASMATAWVMHERKEVRERRDWLTASGIGLPRAADSDGSLPDAGDIPQPAWHRNLFGVDPQYVELYLSAELTEAGLDHLQHQPYLKSLVIVKDRLDDREIERIAKLRNLKTIRTMPALSERQRLQLEAALPGCKIERFNFSF